MVKSLEIKDKYFQLLELVKYEAEANTSIWDYYNYLNEYRSRFSEESNLLYKQDLREFLRGANRYSDEFIFSDKNYSAIREVTNILFDILCTK